MGSEVDSMNGKPLSKVGWISAWMLAVLAIGDAPASAGLQQIFVTVGGTAIVSPVATVASVTGGTTAGGKSVTTPNGVVTTASISLPLVITRSETDRDLVRFAAVELMNPSAYPRAVVRAQTFDQFNLAAWKITKDQMFQNVVVTRMDIPGTFGPAAQHGNFVITANVASMQTNTASSTPILNENLPQVTRPSAYPSYWAVHLSGLLPLDSSAGAFTFEPFSLSTGQTSLALTLHSQRVTSADLTTWVKNHPNGEGSLEWTQTSPTGDKQIFFVQLKNIGLGTTTNDTTGQPAITTHLSATIGQMSVL